MRKKLEESKAQNGILQQTMQQERYLQHKYVEGDNLILTGVLDDTPMKKNNGQQYAITDQEEKMLILMSINLLPTMYYYT